MIIISALDNSGQLYGAELLRELKGYLPNEEFIGIGGTHLAEAGCKLIYDISNSSAMLTGVIGALKWAIPAYRKLVKIIRTENPKLVILIDSPTFNLPLARSAKKHNAKTLYYIAPQTWAWAQFRTKKIKKRVDKLAVILPFEEQYFRNYDIDAEFVGHPFINYIRNKTADPELQAHLNSLAGKKLLIMPGSRNHIIRKLLPIQLEIAKIISSKLSNLNIFITAWKPAEAIVNQIVSESDFPSNMVKIFSENHNAAIQCCDLALACSGTGTLELAYHAKPMIIMYHSSKILYHLIAKHLIHTRYLSLINILAGRELAPEFMPYIKNKNAVAEEAIKLLTDEKLSENLGNELHKLVQKLYKPSPASAVAKLAYQLIAAH